MQVRSRLVFVQRQAFYLVCLANNSIEHASNVHGTCLLSSARDSKGSIVLIMHYACSSC